MTTSATQAGASRSAGGEVAPAMLSDLVAGRWPASFQGWVERVARQGDPSDPLAVALVERLAVAAWRLRGLEAADLAAESPAPAVQRDRLRARAQADRDFSRALADLLRYRRTILQANRREPAPAAAERPSARRARHPEPAPTPGAEPIPTDRLEPVVRDGRGAESGGAGPPDRVDPTDAAPPDLAELASRAPADWAERFGIDPAVSPHWPVLRGTRRLAETVACALVAAPTLGSVRERFADLSPDDLAAVARLETLGRAGPWPPGLEEFQVEPVSSP